MIYFKKIIRYTLFYKIVVEKRVISIIVATSVCDRDYNLGIIEKKPSFITKDHTYEKIASRFAPIN